MSSSAIEGYLARLYADKTARDKFLADPEGEARHAGLNDADTLATQAINGVGLHMARTRYAYKREQHCRPRRKHVDALITWFGKRQFAGWFST